MTTCPCDAIKQLISFPTPKVEKIRVRFILKCLCWTETILLLRKLSNSICIPASVITVPDISQQLEGKHKKNFYSGELSACQQSVGPPFVCPALLKCTSMQFSDGNMCWQAVLRFCPHLAFSLKLMKSWDGCRQQQHCVQHVLQIICIGQTCMCIFL